MSIGINEHVEQTGGTTSQSLDTFLGDSVRVNVAIAHDERGKPSAWFSRFRFETTGAIWKRSGERAVRVQDIASEECARSVWLRKAA